MLLFPFIARGETLHTYFLQEAGWDYKTMKDIQML